MQIAVFVCRDDLITLREREYGYRLIARFQGLALAALLGLQHDPLDVVRVQHGMLHSADADGHDLAVDLDDRYMLFSCRVSRVREQELHLLAAALSAHAGVVDVRDDVAAMFASEKRHEEHLLAPIIGEGGGFGKGPLHFFSSKFILSYRWLSWQPS